MANTLFIFKVINFDEFITMKREWNTLLANSDANTLFLTWEWLNAWWAVWGDKLDLELNIIGCYNQEGKLLGLAPMYRAYGKVFKCFNTVRLGILGTSHKFEPTIRSEFQDFIVEKSEPIIIRKMMIDEIFKDNSWDELILSDVKNTSITFALFTINKYERWPFYLRVINKDSGVKVNTKGQIKEYLVKLGKNIRSTAFNKNKILNAQYCVMKECVVDDFTTSVNILNDFHLERWGKLCFDRDSEKFHSLVFSETEQFQSYFLKIKANNETISISYNIDYMESCHNIQLGFDSSFDKKFALGYMNLGELISDSFIKPKILSCDMLLGSGQKTFYKERFKGDLYNVSTLQLIRSPILIYIFRLYDVFKRAIK